MPDDATEPEPRRKPVIARVLVPLDWTLWSILLVVLLYWLVRVSTERTSSPEAGPGLGIFAVVSVLVVLAVVGVLLNSAARKQSAVGLITLTVVLAWPCVFLVADPLIRASRNRRFANADASVGDFNDTTLASMAQAIARNDSAALAQQLAARRPPDGSDRAGNDLLAYALVMVREKGGRASTVRALLDAGADPRTTRMAGRDDVVHYTIFGHSEEAHDALRALLEHGADPNVVHSASGDTPLGAVNKDPEIVRILIAHGADLDRLQSDGSPPVVRFIGTRQWESAVLVIEKGARLDLVNPHGLSVDYYLNDWKESVFGDHPEGWARVREAIGARRAAGR